MVNSELGQIAAESETVMWMVSPTAYVAFEGVSVMVINDPESRRVRRPRRSTSREWASARRCCRLSAPCSSRCILPGRSSDSFQTREQAKTVGAGRASFGMARAHVQQPIWIDAFLGVAPGFNVVA